MSTPHGFWISVPDNRVFDGLVTRHLIAHGDIIAIHGFYTSDSYPFADIAHLPVIGGGAEMNPDRRWHALTLDLDTACAGSRRYQFRRALFTRLLGSLDITMVRVGDTERAATGRTKIQRRKR